MLTCFFCGGDATTGWVCGPPPASERYKLALCPVHDNPKNRARVEAAWEELMRDEMRGVMALAQHPGASPARYEVAITFLQGGEKRIICSRYEVSSERDLLVLTDKGELEFYPLQHVQRFKVVELTAPSD